MNKNTTHINIAEKRFRRRLKSKLKRKKLRKHYQDQIDRGFKPTPKHRSPKLRIPAPENFSFSENRKGVLSFIGNLEKALNSGKTVFVKLDSVEHIDQAAITLLLGIMAEFQSSGIYFNGDFPRNTEAKETLIKSGFLKQLYPNDGYYFGSKSSIYTHGNKVYDEDLTCEELSEALICVFGERRRSQGARKVLIEAMKNTLLHASMKRERHWWMSFKKDSKNNKLTVSMLDYGVGIFNSLKNGDEDDPGYKWYEKWIKLGANNYSILEKIMKGELKAISRSRIAGHGTGLPGMRKAFGNQFVSKLVIISNDVYADVGAEIYEPLGSDFSGTLIQFEITPECKSFPYG